MKKPISIIIPTFNNPDYLNPCVSSIVRTGILDSMAELIIVNNGDQDIHRLCGHVSGISIIKSPTGNAGWEGGLKLGLENSESPFVVFQNDDTFIPLHQCSMYQRLLSRFSDDHLGAVAPVTTVAAGPQSIYHPNTPSFPVQVPYLIFYTVMIRREALDKVGGVDISLPGGDDIDMSIRLIKAGYKIMIDPHSFLIHHAFKTGERVNGSPDIKGGWNSNEMRDRTNIHLIRKHGFKTFVDSLQGTYVYAYNELPDAEGEFIRSHINGHKNIVELGCGSQKTVLESLGIDRIPKGERIPHLNHGAISVADITADVSNGIPLEDNSQDLIIARHVLEHCINEIKTLRNWIKILRPGGEIIIAVPDERVQRGIPLNPEHVRAYTPDNLSDVMEILGMEKVKIEAIKNNTSFVGIFRKPFSKHCDVSHEGTDLKQSNSQDDCHV